MSIFKEQEFKKPSFIQKLVGKQPTENGMVEINNLLARHQGDVDKVSLEDILDVEKRYKLDLKKNFKDYRVNLYRDYLSHCLKDSKLHEYELEKLKHLQELLLLNEMEVKDILFAESKKKYEEHVQGVVSDGRLTDKEHDKLERLKTDLLLPEGIAKNILASTSKKILKDFISGAVSDQRLSPEEESELEAIAKSLNINIQMDDKSKAALDKFKLYWQIENAEIPTITPDINIQKSENLYFKTDVKWLEQRRVTKRINYGGPTLRIKIARGLYYRAGSMNVQSVSEDVWKTIDNGTIYLTNKRLIFMGGLGNKTIRLNKILNIQPFTNGVDIQKDAGKSPFLEFSNNTDLFSMILVRLMDES